MPNATVIKTLPKPWNVAGRQVTDIELREPTVKDFTEAEKDGNPNWTPQAYRASLAAQTMVRAGDFTGPFTSRQLWNMCGANWRVVSAALDEAEKLGEVEQPGQMLST